MHALMPSRGAARGGLGPFVLSIPARGAFALALSALAWVVFAYCLLALGAPGAAHAAEVSCPNSNPIVNENNCMGAGTRTNELVNYSEQIGGFTTKTSYNLGESVPLKIGTSAASFPGTAVNIAVYRIGYYGGQGARLISAAGASNVKVPNSLSCEAMNATTGELSCANWSTTYTIPGKALPVSGIYEAVFTDVADGGIQNYVVFALRNDARASQVLYVLPSASYEAYNNWGCKSLYFDKCGGENTIAGDGRAVAVSFDRPLEEGEAQRNRFFGPDDVTVEWLEEQGYDVTYTDDIQTDQAPSTLLDHKIVLISGHSEYWSAASFNNVLAAREHGVNILSLSANTAYWQTRYTDNYRTLVCYKTIQGSSTGNGSITPNDPASLGPDGIAHTADDQPQLATTTRRDPGAPAGTPGTPPGGRIGPNEPENKLFGVLYTGDNESELWGLTIPVGNAGAEYAANRVWRNAGLPANAVTTIDSVLVGWEWDQIPNPASPVYAGPAAVEPAGVKRLSLTDTSSSESSWLQDSGRERANTPPPGQASNTSAVEYRTAAGTYVFASGTMQWAFGFDTDRAIDQATYNVISEMGVQPATPASDIVLDPPNAPKPPWASFTVTPTTLLAGQAATFDASASSDSEAKITNYAWDLDGSGTFATKTGTTPTLTHTFAQPGLYNVILKITDSAGQSDVTTRTVNVVNPVSASLRSTSNPAAIGQSVTFDASASSDQGSTITDYKWDLNGDGTYETDTGSKPTVSTSFTSAGAHSVSVQVTDAAGNSAKATVSENVVSIGISRYADGILATPSLLHYYRLDESGGPTIHDAKGQANGTLAEATFGTPGAVNGDGDTAVSFAGPGDPKEGQTGSSGAIPVDLSAQSTITVEFWLKWSQYTNNDALAMEFTPNYNEHPGGFLVDPNAPEFGGTFGVGIGSGTARNDVFFTRPSAGVWHHYALVLDATAPAESEITPYVDGQLVSYQHEGAGTGAGAFTSSTLYLMSRAGGALFGSGALDELAIYGGALSTARIQEHYEDNGTDPRPVASLEMTPSPARAGQTVTFNAAKSSYTNGTIARYEWDLDGNGTYERTTTTPTVTASYATAQTVNIGLRVVDSNGGWDYITQPLRVGNFPPEARIGATPSPALTGQTVTLDASHSTDQGAITDYRWDLDGNGTYETDTGSKPTVTTSSNTIGAHAVGVQVTDEGGLTATANTSVEVLEEGISDYSDAVLGTPGLLDYYRLGESTGPTIKNLTGGANGSISGGTFGLEGALAGDPDTALGFNGLSNFGTVPLSLSSTNKVTVEFWLKWNQYASNDALAMEFTPNFNANAGGFLVDPNAPEFGGTFGVGIGSEGSRNSIFFARPSAGAWHHYAFVLNSGAPASSEITPYVDGQPVSFQQESAGTGAGAFANSTLYLFSRAGGALFGAGTLDELAIYNGALGAGTVLQHYLSHGTNRPPVAALKASTTTPAPEQNVTLDASASEGRSAAIVDYQWDLNGDGTYETDTGNKATLTTSFAKTGTFKVAVRVVDANNASASTSVTMVVRSETYSAAVLSTAGLLHYYRLDESAGPTIDDAKGSANGTVSGGLFGQEGGVAGDADTAIHFNGAGDFGAVPMDLSGTSQLTIEFWLKLDSYNNEDGLAMEFTPNFNANAGGLLIDPNAPEFGGTFGVGIGMEGSRNSVFFARPSVGVWHHYAFVLDSTALAGSEITAYVDGQPVSVQQGSTGTGAGPFANSTLYLMSRAGSALFSAGTLDEVAIYNQPLSAATIAAHYADGAP
jgi:PKD repeat protein